MWTTRLSASAPAVLILSALCVHQMIFKTVLNASWNDSRVKAVIWWHLRRTDHVVCQLNQLNLDVFRNIKLWGRLHVIYQVRLFSFSAHDWIQSSYRFLLFVLFFSDKECIPIVDVGFVIDSSGSIGRRNWARMKRFLKAIVSKLDVSPSYTHISAVAYSNNPVVVYRFNNRQATDSINNAFDGMRWQRGFTYTDKALLLADSDLYKPSNGMRPNVAKVKAFLQQRLLVGSVPWL